MKSVSTIKKLRVKALIRAKKQKNKKIYHQKLKMTLWQKYMIFLLLYKDIQSIITILISKLNIFTLIKKKKYENLR